MNSNAPMQFNTLIHKDIQLAYQHQSGQAPGVLFLGGFLSNMTGSKATALAAWCQAHRRAFLRFDYSGHGASGGSFTEGTIGRWLEEASAILEQCTTGPQIVVGSSMGAWIMLLLALQRPLRIAGLVGVASAADFTETLWRQLTDKQRQQLETAGVIHLPADYPDRSSYPLTHRFIEESRQHFLLNRAAIDIQCPIRLLHGMQDHEVPFQTSIRIAECVTSSDVQVILVKDGEHRLSRPADLQLLTDLLEDLSP